MTWTRVTVVLLGLFQAATPALGASEKLVVDGSSGVIPLVAALAKVYQERHPAATVEVGKGLGTKARIQALAEGKIDIALASHGFNVEELSRQGMAVHEIAKVPVVFGVNAGVPVTNLTDRQICDIYAGKIANWRQLGGPDLAIAPRTRPDTEVDAQVVKDKIGCLKELRIADTVKVMPRSGDMARELGVTPGAIGVTTMTVVEQGRRQIKPVALNGIESTAENVRRKLYTLTRDSMMVVKVPPSPAVARFLEFVRSPEGEVAIVANGAIPAK